MRSVKSAITQYGKNITIAKGQLGTTDSALGDASDLLKSAYTIALQGANATVDQASRQGLAQQVADFQSRLVQLGNSKNPNGGYIFAGQKTDTIPFNAVAGVITYSGDNNSVLVETNPGATTVVNTQGNQLFTDAYNHLETLRNNLLNGTTSAISLDITNLQADGSAMDNARAVAGTVMKGLQIQENYNSRRVDELAGSISDLAEVDITQAIMEYSSAQSAYQAALTVTSQGFRHSLMDYISG